MAGLFGGGGRAALIALLAGMAAVIAAGTVDSIWRRRHATYTTSDWLRRRRNPSPSPVQVSLLLIAAILWGAAFFLTRADSPRAGFRHDIYGLLVLVYVIAIGTQLLRKAPGPQPSDPATRS